MFSHIQLGCLAAATVVPWLSGCGSGRPTLSEEVVAAEGTLMYRGEALPFHQIIFSVEDHLPATGVSDEKGHFVLGTNIPGDGAVAGANRVSVSYVGPPNRNPNIDETELPPPPPPKVKVPAKYTNLETSGIVVEIPQEGSLELKVDLR